MSETYGTTAFGYWDAGWRSVLPVPYGQKKKPPQGYTGYDAEVPSYADVMAWTEDRADWNLALRLPADVVGLDVDAYGEKTGAATFAEALRRWGPLPPTVRSTSRLDDVSGIRLYRKPADVSLHTQIRFPELAVGHIEVVQVHHRYCMAWPSMHPEGRTYQWLDNEGNVVGIPVIDTLPMLPGRWVEGLRADSFTEITAHKDPIAALRDLRPGDMSVKVEQALHVARRELDCDPGSRHDVANVNVLRLLRLGEMGEPGVQQALALYRSDFVAAIRDRATEAEANAEYGRMVFGQRGHNLIASTPSAAGDWATLGVGDSIRQQAERVSEIEVEPTEEYDEEPETDADAWLFADELPPAAVALEQGTENPILAGMLTVAGLASIEPADPLIEGMLFRNTLAQISGHPGTYKSFLALSIACSVAAPGDLHKWVGETVRYHGPVVYVAAEGASGLRARILAWCDDQSPKVDPDRLRLYVYPEAVQLGSWKQVEALIDAVRQLDACLVVFDTRALCSLDLDENDAKQQGTAVDNAHKIRAANGCTVLMVHHSAKSGNGPRGSSAWDGAVHSDLRITAEDKRLTVECHKHKDSESGCTHEYEMRTAVVPVELMPDVEEENRTTLIATKYMGGFGKGPDLDVEQKILEVVRDHDVSRGVTEREIVLAGGFAETGSFRPPVRAALRRLLESNRLRDLGGGKYQVP